MMTSCEMPYVHVPTNELMTPSSCNHENPMWKIPHTSRHEIKASSLTSKKFDGTAIGATGTQLGETP